MKRVSTIICFLALAISACDSEGIDRAAVFPAAAPASSTGGNSGALADANSQNNGGLQSDNAQSADLLNENTNDTQTIPTPSADTNNGQPSTNAPVVSPTSAVPFPETVQSNVDSDAMADGDNTPENEINLLGGSGSSDGGLNSNPATSDNNSDVTDAVTEITDDTDNTGNDSNNNQINMLGGSGSSDGGNSSDNSSQQTASQDDAADTSLSLSAPTSGTTFVSTTSPIRYGGPECSKPHKDDNSNLIFNGKCPTVQRAGNVAFGDFLLSNNTWNDCASAFENWSQCISVDDSSGKVKPRWDYDWGNESEVRGAVWLVKSYPEVIYGVKSPGEYSASTLAETVVNTGLPAKLDNLPFYKISYTASSDEYPSRSKDYNGQTIHGERNIAIESFFHELGGDCDVNTLIRSSTASNQRFELMVWVDAGPERLPAAPSDYVTTTTIDDQQYDVYTKPSDREYIAFVAKNSRSTADLNWNSFIEWSREYSHRVNEVFGQGSNTVKIQDSWCLANILLGTEIWWGNGFFQLDDYTIQRTVQ